MSKRLCRAGLMAVALVLAPAASAERDAGQGAAAAEERARAYFSDRRVVDHSGREQRFYSDVLKGRTVAITFFYTECIGMCPIVNGTLSAVQDLLGERLGEDIFLVSISIDPETDTPELMREYRKKYAARDGWLFLTGEPADIGHIAGQLGQRGPKEIHPPVIFVGNLREHRWQKLPTNLSPKAIANHLEAFAKG